MKSIQRRSGMSLNKMQISNVKEKNILIDLAQKALQSGDLDRAIYEYESALKLDPEDLKLHNILGDLFVRKNKISEAIKKYILVAEKQREKGFALRAIALYKKVSRLVPDLPEPYEKMAELYVELEHPFEAKANYLWLMDYFEGKKDNKKKIEILKKLADLEVDNLSLRAGLAQMYIDAGMKVEAAIEYLKIGIEYFKKSEIKKAMFFFEESIGLNSDCFGGYKWLGKCYFSEGEIDKAITLFEKARSFNPDEIDNLILLAKSLCRVDRNDRAVDVFIEILELEPSLTTVREKLARLYLKKGALEEAKLEFKKVVESFLERKQFKDALVILDEIKGEIIFDLELREKLAKVLKMVGEKDRAIEEYESLVQIYESNGLYEKAIKTLEKILNINPDLSHAKKWLDELLENVLLSEKDRMVEKRCLEDEIEKEDDFRDEKLEKVEVLLKEGLVNEAIEYLEGEEEQSEEEIVSPYAEEPSESKLKLKVKDKEEGKSEDFFDLREALKKDLEDSEQKGKGGKRFFKEGDQFLDEILDQLRMTINKQIDLEDYNTHYDLGLAYMEMELFEDAAEEFQKALKDPSLQRGGEKKFLDYCNLLGTCFIKIGLFQEASRELERGLSVAGYAPEDYIPLKLSKAIVLENLTKYDEALKFYTEVLSIDSENEYLRNKVTELKNKSTYQSIKNS